MTSQRRDGKGAVGVVLNAAFTKIGNPPTALIAETKIEIQSRRAGTEGGRELREKGIHHRDTEDSEKTWFLPSVISVSLW